VKSDIRQPLPAAGHYQAQRTQQHTKQWVAITLFGGRRLTRFLSSQVQTNFTSHVDGQKDYWLGT